MLETTLTEGWVFYLKMSLFGNWRHICHANLKYCICPAFPQASFSVRGKGGKLLAISNLFEKTVSYRTKAQVCAYALEVRPTVFLCLRLLRRTECHHRVCSMLPTGQRLWQLQLCNGKPFSVSEATTSSNICGHVNKPEQWTLICCNSNICNWLCILYHSINKTFACVAFVTVLMLCSSYTVFSIVCVGML